MNTTFVSQRCTSIGFSRDRHSDSGACLSRLWVCPRPLAAGQAAHRAAALFDVRRLRRKRATRQRRTPANGTAANEAAQGRLFSAPLSFSASLGGRHTHANRHPSRVYAHGLEGRPGRPARIIVFFCATCQCYGHRCNVNRRGAHSRHKFHT